jgi:hypothetical protein
MGMFQLPAGSFPDRPCVNFYGTELSFWQIASRSPPDQRPRQARREQG